MANFFNSAGTDDQRPESSHGDDFFSFKNDENSGGSIFGNSSSSGGGGDQESFFKPSTASKNEESFFDFGSAFPKPEGNSTEAEPTFLAPFSRTPPRKKQNQGPPPTPSSQSTFLQQSAGLAKMECSSTSSPQLSKGDGNSSLGRSSRSAVPGLESALTAPSSNSQTFGGASASPAQKNPNTQINAAQGKGFNEVDSQQHGLGFGVYGQVSPMEGLRESSKGVVDPSQQSKEMSNGLLLESKCGVGEVDTRVGNGEERDTARPLGRIGGSNGELKLGGQPPLGRGPSGGAHVQVGHRVGGDLLQQLLVGKHTLKVWNFWFPRKRFNFQTAMVPFLVHF